MGVYPEVLKAGTQKDVCIPTFIAASFIIAKRSIGRWIDNNVYTDMTEHQPALEKEGHSDMGYDIDEAWGHDAEISQTQQINTALEPWVVKFTEREGRVVDARTEKGRGAAV